MIDLKKYEVWFVTGSQHLYGPEVLKQVDKDSAEIAAALDKSGVIPCKVIFKPVLKTPDEITKSILVLVDAVKTLKASEFALTLADKGSNLQLLSITEKESIEEIEKLTETLIDSKIDQDALERLHRKEIKALIDGIVSEAKARGVKVERTHLVGEKVKLTLKEAKEKHTIIVLASSLDQNNILETEVENLARLSRIPVLIVKT